LSSGLPPVIETSPASSTGTPHTSSRGRVLKTTHSTRYSPSKYIDSEAEKNQKKRPRQQRLDLASVVLSDTESEETPEEEEEKEEEEVLEAVKKPRKSTRVRTSMGAKAARAIPASGRKRGLSLISSDEGEKSEAEEEEEEEEEKKPEQRKRRQSCGGKAPRENQKQRTTSVPDTNPMDADSDPGVCVCVCACACVCVCVCLCMYACA
jgi:hypothetical protein